MSDQFSGWGSQPVPYSQEAEEATIGAILINPMAYLDVAAFLNADDFFLLRHRYIWQALGRLSERNEPIDYLPVIEELKAMGKLDEIGGPAFITQLINSTPTSMHAYVYAKLVQRAAVRRRLVAASDQVKALALNEELDIDEVCLRSQQAIDGVQVDSRQFLLSGAESIRYYDALQDKLFQQRADGEMTSYPLPDEWYKLRELIPAIYPGDFIVVSGLPGSGKSSFLEQWAEHCARLGLWVSYTHTEMNTDQILHRRMARHSGLNYDLLASGAEKTPVQRELMLRADEEIYTFSKRLSYRWSPDVHFPTLQLAMRRDAIAGVKVFFIDHFQDVQVDGGGKDTNLVRAYEKACIWLAAFAEFRRVVVVVASQENKQGSTKWSAKLIEKALTRISIKRDTLTSEYAYLLNNVDYRAMPGEANPVADIDVTKARFGKRGRRKMLNHGPVFKWLDLSAARKVAQAKPAPAKSFIEKAADSEVIL